MILEDLRTNLRQYLSLKGEVELLTNRIQTIKTRLTEHVEQTGETTEKGHLTLTVDDPIKGKITLTKQRKVSNPLDITAAEILLEERGIKESCIKMVPTLDDAAIMAAYYKGQISEEDIDKMFPEKVTYAFIVKEA
jgi:hypothetical protein